MIEVDRDLFFSVIATSISIAGSLDAFGLSSSQGYYYRWFHSKCEEWNVATGHFLNGGQIAALKSVRKSRQKNNRNLKRDLIEKRGYKCDTCAISDWCGTSLTLQLDHIDGNNRNDEESNLRLLCPNCHSQTETFSGRNARKTPVCKLCRGATVNKRGRLCSDCKEQSNLMKWMAQRKVERPSREELEEMLRVMPLTRIGAAYCVSSTAIKRWADQYNIDPLISPYCHKRKWCQTSDSNGEP